MARNLTTTTITSTTLILIAFYDEQILDYFNLFDLRFENEREDECITNDYFNVYAYR